VLGRSSSGVGRRLFCEDRGESFFSWGFLWLERLSTEFGGCFFCASVVVSEAGFLDIDFDFISFRLNLEEHNGLPKVS
jgi:hypothetical protein